MNKLEEKYNAVLNIPNLINELQTQVKKEIENGNIGFIKQRYTTPYNPWEQETDYLKEFISILKELKTNVKFLLKELETTGNELNLEIE